MPDDLSAAFQRVITSTERLNRVADAVANTVRDVETLLEEAGVGLRAAVVIYYLGDPDDEPEGSVNLEYRRVAGGKFRIAVVHYRNDGGDAVEIGARAWSECNREEKLAAFGTLPKLLIALAEGIEKKAAEAEQILSAVAPQLPAKKRKVGGA